ncbi:MULTISPECIES: hypothetical protein [Streptomyces]|uniref:hypothetical protein n=1 Tax=Streptomyces TaxID=1883 RepID=UPI001E51A43B|nr:MULTISPECIES: hypothetical protein [Streptomyces]UFQ17173.1 hypothetical protein J2N69_20385 [Streptomyces huasconensis]WCL86773.1 hypothetical protein PPN52_20390 [Streptomyces sp. JCM 35825]
MITTQDIRRILVDSRTLAGVEAVADDTEITVDSFSLAWLSHSLKDEFGIELDLREARAEAFSSINRITAHVNELTAKAAASGETR